MIAAGILAAVLAMMLRELAAARADSASLLSQSGTADAYRERDAILLRAIAAEGAANRRLQLILEAHRLATLANDCGARWVKTTTPAVLQHPDQEPALEMMSAISSTMELTRKSAQSEGFNHGRTA